MKKELNSDFGSVTRASATRSWRVAHNPLGDVSHRLKWWLDGMCWRSSDFVAICNCIIAWKIPQRKEITDWKGYQGMFEKNSFAQKTRNTLDETLEEKIAWLCSPVACNTVGCERLVASTFSLLVLHLNSFDDRRALIFLRIDLLVVLYSQLLPNYYLKRRRVQMILFAAVVSALLYLRSQPRMNR